VNPPSENLVAAVADGVALPVPSYADLAARWGVTTGHGAHYLPPVPGVKYLGRVFFGGVSFGGGLLAAIVAFGIFGVIRHKAPWSEVVPSFVIYGGGRTIVIAAATFGIAMGTQTRRTYLP
jgi:hypothetical protein